LALQENNPGGETAVSVPTSAYDEIARVAHAIWEAKGHPEGRDHEHWMRAKRLVEEGRADAEFPRTEETARPVQPGFEDAAPGMVPEMKAEPFEDIDEGAGGRFAEQLADLPESGQGARRKTAAPKAGTARTIADAPAPKRPRKHLATPSG
jgi:hypothetical protein